MAYATQTDLFAHGLPRQAVAGLTDDQINGALDTASEEIDSYLRGRYRLPFVRFGSDIVKAGCRLAAEELLTVRGWDPNGADKAIQDRAARTRAWLEDCQRMNRHPDVTAQPDQPTFDQPSVVSFSAVAVGSSATAPTRGY